VRGVHAEQRTAVRTNHLRKEGQFTMQRMYLGRRPTIGEEMQVSSDVASPTAGVDPSA
jgi:hypothetical protein